MRRSVRRYCIAGVGVSLTLALMPSSGSETGVQTIGTNNRPAGVAEPFQILVTNDDGVGAPGIAAVVDALQTIPNVDVTVVAPKTNQSGTSDSHSNGPLTVEPAMTANGDAAIAVSGFPADTVWWAVRTGAVPRPDLIVSGINFGNNAGDLSELSGTVGAARASARLGIPAVAASQGLSTDFSASAPIVRDIVAFLRPLVESAPATVPARILKIEVPSCTTGAVRGGKIVPVAEVNTPTAYALTVGTATNGTYQPTITSRDPFTANCNSTKTEIVDDIDAVNNGFYALSVLNHNLGDS